VFKGTVKVGEATLDGGAATVALPGSLPAGSNALTVKYLGTTNINGATKPITVTVAKAASSVEATSVTNAVKGKTATVVIAVTGVDGQTPTGTVRVKVGTLYVSGAKTVALVDGVWQATVTTTALPVGTLSVEYSGNANLLSATKVTGTVIS